MHGPPGMQSPLTSFELRRLDFAGARVPLLCGTWAACFLVLSALVQDHPLRDPDSIHYEQIARALSTRPLVEWIAPRWEPSYSDKLFVEHLACFFWPAAALDNLGLRGALVANFLWVLFSLFLLHRMARSLTGEPEAWVAVFLYALSPAGLQSLVRANHEPALTVAYLGALGCIVGARRRPVSLLLFALLALAVKGGLGLAIFPVCTAAWLATPWRRRGDLAALATSAGLAALLALAYERWFQSVAHESFFAHYLSNQWRGVVLAETGPLSALATPGYYIGNALWFAFPGALLLLQPRATNARRVALGAGGTLLVLLSLMARRAVRYLFPAYSLFQLAGAETLLARFPSLRVLLVRRAAALPYALMALLLVATALRTLRF